MINCAHNIACDLFSATYTACLFPPQWNQNLLFFKILCKMCLCRVGSSSVLVEHGFVSSVFKSGPGLTSHSWAWRELFSERPTLWCPRLPNQPESMRVCKTMQSAVNDTQETKARIEYKSLEINGRTYWPQWCSESSQPCHGETASSEVSAWWGFFFFYPAAECFWTWCFDVSGFPILLRPLTAGAWPAFMLIPSCCVTKSELGSTAQTQLCFKCVSVQWQFRSSIYQIKPFAFHWGGGRVDTWTDRHSCCSAQARYPLTVGVVVAVATGLERGCGPLAHGCSKARRPLVVILKKCICNHCWLGLETFVVQSKEEGLFYDNHWRP